MILAILQFSQQPVLLFLQISFWRPSWDFHSFCNSFAFCHGIMLFEIWGTVSISVLAAYSYQWRRQWFVLPNDTKKWEGIIRFVLSMRQCRLEAFVPFSKTYPTGIMHCRRLHCGVNKTNKLDDTWMCLIAVVMGMEGRWDNLRHIKAIQMLELCNWVHLADQREGIFQRNTFLTSESGG